MSMKATLHFCCANRRTIASPMPEPPPVTRTVLPARSLYVAIIPSSRCACPKRTLIFTVAFPCARQIFSGSPEARATHGRTPCLLWAARRCWPSSPTGILGHHEQRRRDHPRRAVRAARQFQCPAGDPVSGLPLGRGAGLFPGRALPRLERHPERPHAAL